VSCPLQLLCFKREYRWESFTVFGDPLERIRTGLTAGTPLIIGNTENDGTFGLTNLTAVLDGVGLITVSADLVKSLYPGMNDSKVIADTIRYVGIYAVGVVHVAGRRKRTKVCR
jgi:hypothetical protein